MLEQRRLLEEMLIQAEISVKQLGEKMIELEGRQDLTRGIVRAVTPAAFEADGLRLLRGVRIAAETGFHIDANTMTWMRERAACLEGTVLYLYSDTVRISRAWRQSTACSSVMVRVSNRGVAARASRARSAARILAMKSRVKVRL